MIRESTTRFSSPIAGLPGAGRGKLGLASTLCCALALVWAGCTTQQQQQQEQRSASRRHAGTSQQQQRQKPAPAPAPAAAPAPAEPVVQPSCFNPIKSGIVHLSKKAPSSVRLGGEYVIELDCDAVVCAENVVITDYVPSGASYVRSEPSADVDGNKLTWNVGDMDAGTSRNIKVWLRADKEGVLASCATIKADPKVCAETKVVKAAIELTKSEPADALICDPIPATLTVRNSGSSALTGVQITDTLPAGLTADGKSSLVFDAGSMGPGESKDFKYNASATTTGKLVNTAKVTSMEGVSAEASATTTVHQPVLTITCKAQEQQFIGRKFDVSYSVNNTGDATAADTKLRLKVPEGLTVVSASANGASSGGQVVWDLGKVEVNSPQTVTATLSSAAAGSFDLPGTVKGVCASEVSTSCQTKVVGVPAILLEKSDDPDPVNIGDSTTYTVKVTNQGTAEDHNVQVIVIIDSELVPVSTSEGTIDGQTVTLPVVPALAPKQAVTYKIQAKGVTAGDAHTKFKLTSDMLTSPITAEESTHVY